VTPWHGEAADEALEAPGVAYLDGLGRFAQLGLHRVEAVLERMGRPQDALAAYHVAGTNGKGSVSAFIDAMLAAAGVPAGLYTSPHLQTPSERIRVAGERIAGADLLLAAEAVRAAAIGMTDPPTAFEAWTAAALWHFRRAGARTAVVEVGLGGRGDATAVLERPAVSVLTTVHRDHVRQLGSTFAAIAAEKAAIFRPGRPAVLGPLPRPARRVAVAHARALGCPVYALGREVVAIARDADRAGRVAFDLTLEAGGRRERLTGLRPGLAGAHQVANAALAVAAVRAAQAHGGPHVPVAAVREGLAAAAWPGRLEAFPDGLIDGAHNLHGARALAAHVAWLGGDWVWVLAGLTDRPPADLLGPLLPLARAAVATPVHSPRSRSGPAWAAAARRHGRVVESSDGVADALARARALRRPGERILVAGSLYLAGEARTALGLPPAGRRARPLLAPPVQPGDLARAWAIVQNTNQS